MEKPNESRVKRALASIVSNSNEKSLNYAVNYARAGQRMAGHELKVQCLYVLNNMSRWRGDVAKEVRQILKDYSKVM